MRPSFMTKRPLRFETTLGPLSLGVAASAAAQRVDALLHVEAGEARLRDRERAIELQALRHVGLAGRQQEGGLHLHLAGQRHLLRLDRQPQDVLHAGVVDGDLQVDLPALDVLAAHHLAARDDVRRAEPASPRPGRATYCRWCRRRPRRSGSAGAPAGRRRRRGSRACRWCLRRGCARARRGSGPWTRGCRRCP